MYLYLLVVQIQKTFVVVVWHCFAACYWLCTAKLVYWLVGKEHVFGSPKKCETSCKPSIGGFHVTSSPPCWWTKTKHLSLASFVRPPEVVHFTIVIGVSRGWLKTSYWLVVIVLLESFNSLIAPDVIAAILVEWTMNNSEKVRAIKELKNGPFPTYRHVTFRKHHDWWFRSFHFIFFQPTCFCIFIL